MRVKNEDSGPRSVQVYARVTPEELVSLHERARKEGFPTLSAMIRHVLGISEIDYRAR